MTKIQNGKQIFVNNVLFGVNYDLMSRHGSGVRRGPPNSFKEIV
jgi:hypothetical protein